CAKTSVPRTAWCGRRPIRSCSRTPHRRSTFRDLSQRRERARFYSSTSVRRTRSCASRARPEELCRWSMSRRDPPRSRDGSGSNCCTCPRLPWPSLPWAGEGGAVPDCELPLPRIDEGVRGDSEHSGDWCVPRVHVHVSRRTIHVDGIPGVEAGRTIILRMDLDRSFEDVGELLALVGRKAA